MPDTPCPYCGHRDHAPSADRCDQCGGLFEPLSRKATQLAMGPWYLRDEARPFMPGFNETILKQQVAAGRVKADTIVRGPTTHQFWMRADKTPGLSRLLGKCHACGGGVQPDSASCPSCQADQSMPSEVDRLGLSYPDAASRQQAQAELEAMRNAPPAPAPRQPAAPPKPASTTINPELLEPVAPPEQQRRRESDRTPQQAPAAATVTQQHDVAEDVWHVEVPTTTRRRRRRKQSDPLVMVLGVLLLLVVGAGLFVILTGMNPGNQADTDKQAAAETPDEKAERLSVQAARLGKGVNIALKTLRSEGVPEALEVDLERAEQWATLAKQSIEESKFDRAMEQYTEAKELIDALPEKIAAWESGQAAREEATTLRDEVELNRMRAQALNAEQVSEAWGKGESAWSRAATMLEAQRFDDALEALKNAETLFLEALETARLVESATLAQEELNDAISDSPDRETLNRIAAEQMRLFTAQQNKATTFYNDQDYARAERAYRDALSALNEANRLVENARFRKVYAYQAGYHAAGVMLSLAKGEVVPDEALTELKSAFGPLDLPTDPTTGLGADPAPGYAQAAEQLVNSAREAINTTHGANVQACYQAGFQACIVEQTLATTELTNEQQKRIHQSLTVFMDQAIAAGWDTQKLGPVVERVREANRETPMGTSPNKTRAAFAVMIKPLLQRDTAARLMDPVLSPSTSEDPELFPGLGLRGQ